MVVRPPCCPKLGLLSSANSARAQDMLLILNDENCHFWLLKIDTKTENGHITSDEYMVTLLYGDIALW